MIALESPALATHTFGPLTSATTAVQPPKTALIPDLGREELMSRKTSSSALGGGEGKVDDKSTQREGEKRERKCDDDEGKSQEGMTRTR